MYAFFVLVRPYCARAYYIAKSWEYCCSLASKSLSSPPKHSVGILDGSN